MLRRLLKIKDFSKKKPYPLRLKDIYLSGQNKDLLLQSKFLYDELPIRLSQRSIELESLPDEILNNYSLQKVYDLYINSFERILNFNKPNNYKDVDNFANILSDIRKKHKNIELDIGSAIQDFRIDNVNKYTKKERKIDHILNNFYMSRISIRFLIGQHLSILNNKSYGMIDNNCNPYLITQNAIETICSVTNYDNEISYKINGNNNINLMYISSHLYYIICEILKNATVAVYNSEKREKNIDITINNGIEDIIIKISDNGNGIKREVLPIVNSFLYTSSNKNISKENIEKNPVISGFGHGLGLSKIFSNYFGGDIKIVSSYGIGTDIYIYIKKINSNEKIII